MNWKKYYYKNYVIHVAKDEPLWHSITYCKNCSNEINPEGTYSYGEIDRFPTVEKFLDYIISGIPNYCSNCGHELTTNKERGNNKMTFENLLSDVVEAHQLAIEQNLKAHTILINDHLALSEEFYREENGRIVTFPATIMNMDLKYGRTLDDVNFMLVCGDELNKNEVINNERENN